MPLIKFINYNKYGNKRTRIFYHPTSNFKCSGNFGHTIVSLFKYDYTDPIIPPHLITNQKGEKFIVPSWQKVLPETTLNDINWIPDVPKKEREKYDTWEFNSSSSDAVYKVTLKGGKNLTCNCPGFWVSKGNCRHIKEVKSKL